MRGIFFWSSLMNDFLLSVVSSNENIIWSLFFSTIIIFFHSWLSASISTTKLSNDCRDQILVSTMSHVSWTHKIICLFFVNAKSIYAHVKRKIIIAQNKFTNHNEIPMTIANAVVKNTNHDFFLSKCSQLYTRISIEQWVVNGKW